MRIAFLIFTFLILAFFASVRMKRADFTKLEKTINDELAATKTSGAALAIISSKDFELKKTGANEFSYE